jgi:hypothetical protein
MQDEPPEEAHPARCLSLPEVRCPERRPSKADAEENSPEAVYFQMMRSAASVRVKSRSRSQTVMYWAST